MKTINKNRRNFLRFALLGTGVFLANKVFGAEVPVDTIRISKNRIDMKGKDIRNVGKLDVSDRFKLPVGIDLYE